MVPPCCAPNLASGAGFMAGILASYLGIKDSFTKTGLTISIGFGTTTAVYLASSYITLPFGSYNKNIIDNFSKLSLLSAGYYIGANKDYISKTFSDLWSAKSDYYHHSHDSIDTNNLSYNLLAVLNQVAGIGKVVTEIDYEYSKTRMIGDKDTVNLMRGTELHDSFYFSMCGNKIKTIDGKYYISTNYNFEHGIDKVFIFCTKQKVYENDLNITQIEKTESNDAHTLIKYTNPENSKDISLMAFVNSIVDKNDIILNCRWDGTGDCSGEINHDET